VRPLAGGPDRRNRDHASLLVLAIQRRYAQLEAKAISKPQRGGVPMRARGITGNAAFGPRALAVMTEAFQRAWDDLAGYFETEQAPSAASMSYRAPVRRAAHFGGELPPQPMRGGRVVGDEMHQRHLAQADRHIARGLAIISKQTALIDGLERSGRDSPKLAIC
jgi:hypothetical protein